ncbi:hypothetical protein ABPG72_007053 [Tetrahymena utriculariae]
MGWFSKKNDPPKEEKKEDKKQKRQSSTQQSQQDLAKQYESSQDQFMQDSIIQFFNSPVFTSPILDFLDENCIIFQDLSKENMKVYQDIHLNFQKYIEQQLASLYETLGCDLNTILDHTQTMLSSQEYQKYLKIMIIYFHFNEFCKIMVSRNKKLEDMARQGITPQQKNQNQQQAQQCQYEPVSKEDINFAKKQSLLDEKNLKERQKMIKQREDEEYERAILESKKWYEDYLRRLEQEEEDLRRALLLSLEYMRQQGIKEDEQDRKERLEQERKLQEEKERARQEIQRLELENQRLQQEKLKKLQELDQENRFSDLQKSQLIQKNQEKQRAIELEKLRQKQLEEEERRLKEQNEEKQRQLLLQQEEMKRKLLENQERVRKMKEEQALKLKQQQLQEEELQRQLKEKENQKADGSDKKEESKQRQMDAIKKQLYGNQIGNNLYNQKMQSEGISLEQELGYNYEEEQHEQEDFMSNYTNQQGGQGFQNNLLLINADDDFVSNNKKNSQENYNKQMNQNSQNKNSSQSASLNSNSNNKKQQNSNNQNINNNGINEFQFENEDSQNLNNPNQNPYQINPKKYDQNVRKNFFDDLQHDSALKSQTLSDVKNQKQTIKNPNKEDDEDDFYNPNQSNQRHGIQKGKFEDQFDDLFKEIHDLEMDTHLSREQLDDNQSQRNQKKIQSDDLKNNFDGVDYSQRKAQASQQRAHLIQMLKQKRENDLSNYQSNQQVQTQNNVGTLPGYGQQTSANQKTNAYLNSGASQKISREDSYNVSREQKESVKFAEIGKATILKRQF